MQDIKDSNGFHRENVNETASSGSEYRDVEKRTHGHVDVHDPHLRDDDAVTFKTWAVVVVRVSFPTQSMHVLMDTGARGVVRHFVLACAILQHNPESDVCRTRLRTTAWYLGHFRLFSLRNNRIYALRSQ